MNPQETITEKQKAVQIVTIKTLTKLYKNGEEANRIELANCEENGFSIIVEKGLYQIGDKAIYCQPDFSLPILNLENPTNAQNLFLDFTQPEGDSKKTKLGKNGRIRAIKFNFNTEIDSVDPIYSMGIMLPLKYVINKMGWDFDSIGDSFDLDGALEVTKYEEPESAYSGMSKGGLPLGMYSTDENNFNNILKVFEDKFPLVLIGSVKVDGSSFTCYFKNETEFGVRGWLNESTNEFYNEPLETFIPILTECDDTFVKLGKPILEKLKTYCLENNLSLALRGELCGEGLKGSGNKNNPHTKLKQQILFYGADDYSENITKKLSSERFYKICNDLDLKFCDVVFEKEFNDIQEIKDECDSYFKTNLIEGIVLRSIDSKISCKYMNLEYDSKK